MESILTDFLNAYGLLIAGGVVIFILISVKVLYDISFKKPGIYIAGWQKGIMKVIEDHDRLSAYNPGYYKEFIAKDFDRFIDLRTQHTNIRKGRIKLDKNKTLVVKSSIIFKIISFPDAMKCTNLAESVRDITLKYIEEIVKVMDPETIESSRMSINRQLETRIAEDYRILQAEIDDILSDKRENPYKYTPIGVGINCVLIEDLDIE